jgi:hypothetical protein
MSKVIHHPELGDQRLAHLMDQILALVSPTTVPREAFMGLFMDYLPVEIRAELSQSHLSEPRPLSF